MWVCWNVEGKSQQAVGWMGASSSTKVVDDEAAWLLQSEEDQLGAQRILCK